MLIGVVIGAFVIAALGWAFVTQGQKAFDRALDEELQAAIFEARRTLSPEELETLRQQGIELEDIGRRHVREGTVTPREAARRTKRAIIQSTYASLEVNRMFCLSKDKPMSMIFD
jgi:hypothetical protein